MKAEASRVREEHHQTENPLGIPKDILEELRSEITVTRAPLSRDQCIRLAIAKARTKRPVGQIIREAVEKELNRLFL